MNNVISISVLVVLYNKKLEESMTLQTLLNTEEPLFDNLLIWNNGPQVVKKNEFYYKLSKCSNNLKLLNFNDNIPLSVAYNNFIEKYISSEYFVILDDDSMLSRTYFDIFNFIRDDKSIDLILPKIVQNNKVHYPLVNGKFNVLNINISRKKVMSISSGLILSQHLVQSYKKKYNNTIFDERFALYGVDTTFFFRLEKLSNHLEIRCLGEITHSLSRISSPNNKFRIYERGVDVALCARNYPNLRNYKAFAKYLIKSIIIYKDINILVTLIKTFLAGIHIRCRDKYDKD